MDLDESLKLINCKHAGSCTATTQACDVSPSFKCIKAFNKTTTFQHLPEVSLKGNFVSMLNEKQRSGELILKLTHKKALIDHVSSIPDIFTTAMQYKNMKKGFQENEMCNKLTGYYPDLFKLMKTCKRTLTKKEEDLVVSSFGILYECTMENGHIPEKLFDVSLTTTLVL